MPRARIQDRLQNFQFHLLDVSPSLAIPPFVFNPIAGFSAITAPEMTLEIQEYGEGNFHFKRQLISGGSVSNITLSRGASFFDAEFWLWMSSTIKGEASSLFPPVLGGQRRNLLLMQNLGYSANADLGVEAALVLASIGFLAPGSSGGITRVPARAWMLMQCLPVRYKAASDFDATSGEVSVSEIELSVERFEEISIAA